jgi:plasmid stability protein
MANRKGVFIGAYVPADLKKALQQRAASEHRTLSQEITRILEEAVKGGRLPP